MKSDAYKKNETAFRKLRAELDAKYPPGHFLAFDDGQIVADAPSYEELTDTLAAAGTDQSEIFVVQTGVDYPEYGVILSGYPAQQHTTETTLRGAKQCPLHAA